MGLMLRWRSKAEGFYISSASFSILDPIPGRAVHQFLLHNRSLLLPLFLFVEPDLALPITDRYRPGLDSQMKKQQKRVWVQQKIASVNNSRVSVNHKRASGVTAWCRPAPLPMLGRQ